MMILNTNYSPYNLVDSGVYDRWRETKLGLYPIPVEDLRVAVADIAALRPDEYNNMIQRLANFNMVIYADSTLVGGDAVAAKESVGALTARFGLNRLDANLCADEDAISMLSVAGGGRRERYIPYTNRAISWHTDGYYNPPDRRIRAMALHCVQAAADGGVNELMDPEIAYILLRDENPDFIRALMHPHAMLIPENDLGDGDIRPAQDGPVFSVDQDDASLHMRYTARTRSIQWRDDATTRAATDFLSEILTHPSPYVLRHRMQAGEGLLCNNVLHNRTAFVDDDDNQRLVLRARSYDRCVQGDREL
ncbi:MAG: TauD/TfdA family dioxygenase [Alphaproteobacteria bacterium]